MAQKKSKRKRLAPLQESGSALPQTASPEPARGKVRRTGAYLLKHAGETALEYLWAFVGGVLSVPIMTILASAILYLRSPASAWAYTLLKYGLVFLGGTLFPVLVLLVISLIRAYQTKVQERRKALKYLSTEKAWVDYHADLDPAFRELRAIMQEIGKECASVGDRSGELITAIHIQDPKRRKQMVSKGASFLNKHCQKLERASERLAAISVAALDASEGVLRSAPSASEGNRDGLIDLNASLEDVLKSGAGVIENQKQMIETSRAVHGQVSMDVNTSMNWLSAVCEQNLKTLEAFNRRMSQTLFPEIQRKLNS